MGEEQEARSAAVSCLSEERYAVQMETEVRPQLAAVKRTGELAVSGGALYYELYAQTEPADTIVICHGFTEATAKYEELIYYFHCAGFQVAIYDQRGHGRSLRETPDGDVVHVHSFSEYVTDLHCVVEAVVRPFAGSGRLLLYAHSMGGCVAALYMEQYQTVFARAILSAPMLAIQIQGCPSAAAELLCRLMCLLGKGKRRLFTQKGFDPKEPFSASCCDSPARHQAYLSIRKATNCYQTGGASYAWVVAAMGAGRQAVRKRNAARIKTPVLLFQAGRDNQVQPRAQARFVRYAAGSRMVCVPEAKHELYRAQGALLESYITEVLQFFRRHET